MRIGAARLDENQSGWWGIDQAAWEMQCPALGGRGRMLEVNPDATAGCCDRFQRVGPAQDRLRLC